MIELTDFMIKRGRLPFLIMEVPQIRKLRKFQIYLANIFKKLMALRLFIIQHLPEMQN